MKEDEAIKLGFSYTGMSCAAYRTATWAEIKTRAAEIKKLYKGADYRVVESRSDTRGGSGSVWKHIYGNEIFLKAQYFDPERARKWLDVKYDESKADLTRTYIEELDKLEQKRKQVQENYDYLMSLRKKK